MRKLNTSDVFAFARIVKASGMREELKKIIKDVAGQGTEDIEGLGLETILTLLEALAEKKAEKAIYEMLAGPLEKTAEEVETMDLQDLAGNLRMLSEENDLKSFFSYVSGIAGKK